MKKSVIFSLIVVFVFALSEVALAQTEKPVETAPSELPAKLEQMAQNLAQENVTPDMLKQMSEQMKQMAQMLKQMPGMAEGDQKMPMMQQMMPMMQQMMPMMQQMMENKGGMMDCGKMMEMMAMKPKMMPDKPMPEMDPMMQMMPMMPMMGAKQDPKAMGLMMQMRGEMMKAIGEIMMKYGKLMAEESVTAAQPAEVRIEQSANTATYEVALAIGPIETMLTPEEAKTAKEGEVMTSGEMAMSMPDMPLTHHVEVSVKDLMSGTVVTDQAVTITVTNEATQKVANVPVATMYGLDEGVAETHFGNNVALPAGDSTIVVTVGKEAATFHVTIPAL